MVEALVLKQCEFLAAVKNYCVEHNWPFSSNNLKITFDHSPYFTEAHLQYEIYHRGAIRKQHIVVSKEWMSLYLREIFQDRFETEKYKIDSIGVGLTMDLIIIFKKESKITKFFKKIF